MLYLFQEKHIMTNCLDHNLNIFLNYKIIQVKIKLEVLNSFSHYKKNKPKMNIILIQK